MEFAVSVSSTRSFTLAMRSIANGRSPHVLSLLVRLFKLHALRCDCLFVLLESRALPLARYLAVTGGMQHAP